MYQPRIDAAVHLYGDGQIDCSEYLRRREASEREIARRQARATETEKLGVELAMYVEVVEKINRL